MRGAVFGSVILALGTLGALVVFWWSWVFIFFVGQATGLLRDEALSTGLLVSGALAGGAAGLLAGVTAQVGISAWLVRPPIRGLLVAWVGWMLLGAVLSAFFNRNLSTAGMAGLLSAGHLLSAMIYIVVARTRTS